ncbi:MAG: hypothetical protein QME92_09740 [Bacillota bacterium]|nr:hypothetical protein [Bacillota bacterium]
MGSVSGGSDRTRRGRLPLWAGIALLAGGVAASGRWWFGHPGRTVAVFAATTAIALIGIWKATRRPSGNR